MPRGQYRTKYSEDLLSAAVYKVRQKLLSINQASVTYGIPRATIRYRLKQTHHNSFRSGPKTVLTEQEESDLEEWVQDSQKRGFPVTKSDLVDAVKDFLDKNPRKNTFTNNRPGTTWTRLFLKRHPNIAVRKPEFVSAASAKVCPEDIKRWFSKIEDYLESKNVSSILKDPRRIINGDETSFQLNPQTKAVLAMRGSRNVYDVERSSSKVNVTTMFSFLASGEVVPPTIIYPYKTIPNAVAQSVPTSWGIAKSDTGWMTADVFRDYIRNVLNPYLEKKDVEKPVMYIVDGHSSHINLQTSLMCCDLDIILIALYPNVTHIMQPADVAVFKPLKVAWPKAVRKFRNENSNLPITLRNFAGVLQDCVRTSLTVKTIQKGFKASGLYPWTHKAIDFTKCLGKTSAENDPLDLAQNLICEAEDVEMHDAALDARNVLRECAQAIGSSAIQKFRSDFVCLQNDEEGLLFKVFQVLEERCPDILDSVEDNSKNDLQVEDAKDVVVELIDSSTNNDSAVNHEQGAQEESLSNVRKVPESSYVPLKDCLNIPPIPERSAQREYKSKRFHVLTSDEFIQEFQQKENDRKRLEEEKENRKAARIQKKLDAEEKKKQKRSKKEKKDAKPPGRKGLQNK